MKTAKKMMKMKVKVINQILQDCNLLYKEQKKKIKS